MQTGRQGRPGGRVPTIRSRGQAHFFHIWIHSMLKYKYTVICHRLILTRHQNMREKLISQYFVFFLYTNVIVLSGGSHRWNYQFRFRQGSFPPTVFSLYLGKWNFITAPPANAQHWGAAGVSWTHSEDGSNQIRTSDYMGGLCETAFYEH